MMDLTEALHRRRHPRHRRQSTAQLPWGDKTIDFTPPFARKTYDDLFAEHAGVDPHGRRRPSQSSPSRSASKPPASTPT